MNIWVSVTSLLLLMFGMVVGELMKDAYEPSKDICNKCKCWFPKTKDNQTMIIDCTNRELKHVLANWPPHPLHLIASFSRNNITTLQQIPETNAQTLALSFSHCGIKTLESALFIDAVNIEYLDLSFNLLTGQELHADVFRSRNDRNNKYEPIELQELNLAFNKIESLSHSTFEHTPKLIRLNLSNNPLRIIDPQTSLALSSVLNMQVLNISNTQIQKIPESLLSRYHKLRELDISGNKLEKVPEVLSYVGNTLERLWLNNNPIIFLDDESFMGFHSLRELYLNNMPLLKEIKHNTFFQVYNLRTLHCMDNPNLHTIHSEAFGPEKNNKRLEEINLSNNDLQTLPTNLLDWSRLTVLELSGNRWFCDCDLSKILIKINESVIPMAICSEPDWTNGLYFQSLKSLTSDVCTEIENLKPPYTYITSSYNKFFKMTLLILCFALTIVACVFFWRVIVKYQNIRTVNMMYPVVYVSAPTSDTYENYDSMK